MDHSSQKIRGFAALELIIVVAILGAIFMMTLKGAAAIEMMRAIATVHQIRNFQNTVRDYQDQFHHLPGDDPTAPQHWGRPMAMTIIDNVSATLAGDGVMQGPLSDTLNPQGEQIMAWRDLRLSGLLLEGDPALVGQAAMPDNYFDGFYGFAEDNFGLEQVICATLPGRVAAYIDRQLDDGNVATGHVRGTARWDPNQAKNHFATPDTTPYDPDKTYIICTPFLP